MVLAEVHGFFPLLRTATAAGVAAAQVAFEPVTASAGAGDDAPSDDAPSVSPLAAAVEAAMASRAMVLATRAQADDPCFPWPGFGLVIDYCPQRGEGGAGRGAPGPWALAAAPLGVRVLVVQPQLDEGLLGGGGVGGTACAPARSPTCRATLVLDPAAPPLAARTALRHALLRLEAGGCTTVVERPLVGGEAAAACSDEGVVVWAPDAHAPPPSASALVARWHAAAPILVARYSRLVLVVEAPGPSAASALMVATAPALHAHAAALDVGLRLFVTASPDETTAAVLGAVGAGAGALRARYRELAVALHPDKCRHPDAKAAFQRLVTAYGALQKYTR